MTSVTVNMHTKLTLADLTTHEDFLGMYLIKKPDAKTITATLKDINRLKECQWQAYDRAPTTRAETKAFIGGGGGVHIHIFAFCPTNFF